MDILDLIEEAEQCQLDSFGDHVHDLVIAVEGGRTFRGRTELDRTADMVAISCRLGRQGRPISTTGEIRHDDDGGTSLTPVFVPVSRIIFAHYATLEA